MSYKNKDLDKLVHQVGYFEPAFKLYALSKGINVNGLELEKKIPDYLNNYNIKRAKKNTRVVDGKLIDAETDNTPFIPSEILLDFNTFKSIVKVNHNINSPIELEMIDDELFVTVRNTDIKIAVSISRKFLALTNATNRKPVINILGSDRVAILGYEGCSGWLSGKQCKFCDSCASRPSEQSLIPSLNDLNTVFDGNLRSWFKDFETNFFNNLTADYKTIVENKPEPHFHLHVMAGNLENVNEEWGYILRLTERLNRIYPVNQLDSYLNLLPPADLSYVERAKEVGYQKLLYSMEVFGEASYKSVCPEKSELADFSHFMECLNYSVKVFGRGKVRCNFVFGAQHPDLLKNGIEELAGMGVASDFTIFTPKRGTPWEHKSPPAIEEIADITKFLFDTYITHGFEGLYCAESSRSCVLNEMIYCHNNERTAR